MYSCVYNLEIWHIQFVYFFTSRLLKSSAKKSRYARPKDGKPWSPDLQHFFLVYDNNTLMPIEKKHANATFDFRPWYLGHFLLDFNKWDWCQIEEQSPINNQIVRLFSNLITTYNRRGVFFGVRHGLNGSHWFEP